jgi:hypothetical protein
VQADDKAKVASVRPSIEHLCRLVRLPGVAMSNANGAARAQVSPVRRVGMAELRRIVDLQRRVLMRVGGMYASRRAPAVPCV